MIMQPPYVVGDMVWNWTRGFAGIVFAVLPSNDVPDAAERGINFSQPWSFWILGNGGTLYGPLSCMSLMPIDWGDNVR